MNFFSLETMPYYELLLRVALCCITGFFLGKDRAQKDKPIGQQAYIIIMVTTCLLAVTGLELFTNLSYADNVVKVDLAKIIAGVLSGIGFLGAGAIIKRGDDDIVGAATGASIWAAGGLGLMLGFGFYTIFATGFVTVWVVLMLPSYVKKRTDLT